MTHYDRQMMVLLNRLMADIYRYLPQGLTPHYLTLMVKAILHEARMVGFHEAKEVALEALKEGRLKATQDTPGKTNGG